MLLLEPPSSPFDPAAAEAKGSSTSATGMSSPLVPVAAREGELIIPFDIIPKVSTEDVVVDSREAKPEITCEDIDATDTSSSEEECVNPYLKLTADVDTEMAENAAKIEALLGQRAEIALEQQAKLTQDRLARETEAHKAKLHLLTTAMAKAKAAKVKRESVACREASLVPPKV